MSSIANNLKSGKAYRGGYLRVINEREKRIERAVESERSHLAEEAVATLLKMGRYYNTTMHHYWDMLVK